MSTLKKLFPLVFFMAFFQPSVWAQEEPVVLYQIRTTDGNEFVGFIIDETEQELILRTDSFGNLRILKANIVRMRVVESSKVKQGVLWADNPQSTRYFWTPNGYGLEKGEAYYQNIWVLYNQVSVGITQNFSLSAGMVPLFLFGGGSTPFWLVPKFSIPLEADKINMSAGAFIGTVLGEDVGKFGIAFSTITFGSRDHNVNFGLGWGFAGDSWAQSPIVNLGFMARTGPKGYFISENYFFRADDTSLVLLSAGGRRILGAVGLDYWLILPLGPEMEGLYFLPMLGVTVPMGNGKTKK